MNRISKWMIVAGFAISPIIRLQAQEMQQEAPITFNAGFVGDYINNFSGGIRQGNTSLGLINLSAELNTDKAGLWKNGKFVVHSHNVVGNHPSENLIGDVQVASNIDGYTNRFLYEFYYKHTLGKLSVLGGFHNLNEAFYASSFAGLFVNSSFGISPSLSLNNAISIFPTSTLGGIVRYDDENFSLLTGFYNYNHLFASEESFRLKNHLFNKGFYSLAEAQFRVPTGNVTGEYKLGASYRRCNDTHPEPTADCASRNNYSVYFLADQPLLKNKSGRDVGVFVQTGFSPRKDNANPLYVAGGLRLKGFLTHGKEDVLGLAFASARLNQFSESNLNFEYLGNESIVELTLKLPVHPKINIQPDFQYIINPSGGPALSNAFVSIIRTEINF
ncbi:MAG: carbohydrate porin [Bacteroidota bacterium]|nr:carbohydrate porin [Bacteroidota bacterium]